MKLQNYLSLSFAVASAVFLMNVPAVRAVSISPLTFDLTLNPGEQVTNAVRVFNDQASPISVRIDVENFVASGEEGNVILDGTANDTYSLSSWVSVNPAEFTIPANSSGVAQFTVKVPKNAEPGGHYGSVLASISASAASGGLGVSQKVGSLILLKVSGRVTEQLNLLDFTTPTLSEYGPIDFAARFENKGTIHLKPKGFITIKNMFGKEIAKLDLPQSNVLPGSVRRVETPWPAESAFGRYDATLLAIYGSTNEPVTWTVRFWVIPWKLVGGITIGVILLLIFLFRGRRRIRLALGVLVKGEAR